MVYQLRGGKEREILSKLFQLQCGSVRLLTQYKEGRRVRRRLPGWEGLSGDTKIVFPLKVDLLMVSLS